MAQPDLHSSMTLRGSSGLIADLPALRSRIAVMFAQAHQLQDETELLRLAGKDAALVELQLAETIAKIRLGLNDIVDRLERDSGEKWTTGLRVSQFARELSGAKAHLGAATVIWGRLNFAIDQIAKAEPNEDREAEGE